MQRAEKPEHFEGERKDISERLERQMREWNGRIPVRRREIHHLHHLSLTCLGQSLAPVGQCECQVVAGGAEAAGEKEAIPDLSLEFQYA